MQEKFTLVQIKIEELVRRFWRDEAGVELVQVAIVTALLAIASITVLTMFGNSITDYFTAIQSKFDATRPGG